MAKRPNLSDEGAEAQAYFAAKAAKFFSLNQLSSHATGAIKAYTYYGLSEGLLPLELFYMHAARQLTKRRTPISSEILRLLPNDSSFLESELRYEKLCDALSRKKPPLSPVQLFGGNPRLLSSWDFHQRVVDKETYYLGHATHQNVTDYIDDYVESTHDADLWELAVGNGKSAAKRLAKVIAAGGMPRKVYLHDVVSIHILKEAAKELIAIGVPKDRIVLVPDLNLFGEDFSRKKIERITKENSETPNPKKCVMVEGIINDLTIKERINLHRKIKQVFPGAKVITIDDNTTHMPTLKKAYDYPEIPQWLVRSYVPSLWEIGLFEVDPYAIDCRMDFKDHTQGVDITPHITSEGQKLRLPGGQLTYRLPLEQRCHGIYKVPGEESFREIDEEKMQNIIARPFKGSPRFPASAVKVNTWIYNTPETTG